MKIRCLLFILMLVAFVVTGCASRHSSEENMATANAATAASLDEDDTYLDMAYDTQLIADPLEPWNRFVFQVNHGIITVVARPVNTAYTTVVPYTFRQGIGNFFHNLLFPVRFVNSLLQGKGHDAGLEFSRFIINTSAGFGGLMNPAGNHAEFQHLPDADFGQTLGVWGTGEGFYLYWPIIGPSNARDTVGLVGDWAMDPLTYVVPRYGWPLKGLRTVNQLDSILNTYDDITKSAIEPYTAVRDGFIQYRRAKIAR